MFTEDDIIDIYTRAQALADGVLIDCNAAVPGKDIPNEAGWWHPMAMTAAAWELVNISDWSGDGFEMEERLHSVCRMARFYCRGSNKGSYEFHVTLLNRRLRYADCEFALVIGTGDDGETVLTIKLPLED